MSTLLTTSADRKSTRRLRTHVNSAVAGSYLPHALHVGHGEDRLFVVLVRPLTGHPGGQNQALACQRATTLSETPPHYNGAGMSYMQFTSQRTTTLSQTFFRWHYTQLSYSGSIRSSPQDQSYKLQPGTLKLFTFYCHLSCLQRVMCFKKVNPSTILINHVVNSLQV